MGRRRSLRAVARDYRVIWGAYWGLAICVAVVAFAGALRVVNPGVNITQAQEIQRLGAIKRDWVALETLSAHVPLSAIAAEDARFCGHFGFDFEAIRDALEDGARRGASTISQQTAKNVFLWQERSWIRKGLEVGFTTLIEALWGKRRIVEIYLNIAEFDEGVFGIEAAARHHFGVPAAELSRRQAALLMAVLPDPRGRSAVQPSPFTQRRTRQIEAGARDLAATGAAGCIAP